MSRCNGSKISGPQTVVLIMAEKNPKTLTYTQEQNGSPYFSSMVGQCLWLSLPRKIAEKSCGNSNGRFLSALSGICSSNAFNSAFYH